MGLSIAFYNLLNNSLKPEYLFSKCFRFYNIVMTATHQDSVTSSIWMMTRMAWLLYLSSCSKSLTMVASDKTLTIFKKSVKKFLGMEICQLFNWHGLHMSNDFCLGLPGGKLYVGKVIPRCQHNNLIRFLFLRTGIIVNVTDI